MVYDKTLTAQSTFETADSATQFIYKERLSFNLLQTEYDN